jgi:hypothetical protein
LFVDTSTGAVGINTVAPSSSSKLDVYGKIYQNGVQSLYNPSATLTGTLVVGSGGGSLSHTSGDDGYYDTAVGFDALKSITTGKGNTANGYRALYFNTTGSSNTANGSEALFKNITGLHNVAYGYRSLYFNTDSYNMAYGSYSLYSNTTGNRNVGIGYEAGRYIADGTTPNETGAYNFFLGTGTRALADGDTNEIVIGYGATGAGSNSVVLGSDSVIKTLLRGSVGIGTTSPDTALDVNGAITARERSSDPADPDEGSHVCWQSDGAGTGDDGDIICKITAGGTTKTTTLIDFSAL